MRAKQLGILLALVTATVLAGCGGSARLPHSLALRLAAQADEIATRLQAGDTCGAVARTNALRRQVATAVPGSLGSELRRKLNALAASIGPCAPPHPPPPENQGKHHGHGKGNHNEGGD